MERIWSPWRSAYIESFKSPTSENQCIFCEFPTLNTDEEKLILHRGKYNYVIMNLFPYNSGHLMIVPYQHTIELGSLSSECSAEIISLLAQSQSALENALNAQGFNIGVNLGKVAGAGIEKHIHFHIVPRWNGDTNFMPVFADIKVVPEEMIKTYNKLKPFFKSKV